jgi:hypothetical protein
LDKVAGELLTRAWAAGAGPGEEPVSIDVDSSIIETYRLAKQGGAKFTYHKVRGYNALLAVIAGTRDVVHHRLRGGNAGSGRGAASFLTETFGRVRTAGATATLTLGADSGFYSGKVASACRAADVRFSITVRLNKAQHTVIAQIPDDAWTPIPYFLDGADEAEITCRPFGKKAALVRLIVRRVKPHPRITTGAAGRLLLPRLCHRPARRDDLPRGRPPPPLRRGERDPRPEIRGWVEPHAIGQVRRNTAWLALNVMAHNVARWTSRVGFGETP